MPQRNAEVFINDLLENNHKLREKFSYHFSGQPFSIEDLAFAAQGHGYIFTADDFRNAYDENPLRQRELQRVMKDELGWTAPGWLN